MTSHGNSSPPAGLLIRLSAVTIDFTCVLFASRGIVWCAQTSHRYFQPELTFLLTGGAYAVGTALAHWRTVGKKLCDLAIINTKDNPPPDRQALLRELAKLLSFVPLGAGFWWAAKDRQRLTWHDRLAGTRVVSRAAPRRRRAMTGAGMALLAFCIGWYVWDPAASLLATERMAVPDTQQLDSERRSPALSKDVRELTNAEVVQCAQWVGIQGRDPLTYAIARAREHQLLVFGEIHEQGDTLRWFNQSIPVLYQDGGVTCIAMEVLLAEDNAAIERLVNSDSFDRDSAMRIARHQYWAMWGWKEYWDILETVWRVNHSAPAAKRHLRLIGLDQPIDAPSLMMMGFGDVPVKEELSPLEKLRLWRLPKVMAVMIWRDGMMAQEVKREIFDKDERGLAWVGSMHSATDCRLPGREHWGQFGLMLRNQYGDRVFGIRLHQMDIPGSAVVANNVETPKMASFVERVIAQSTQAPVGFDLTGSPLAMLRDRGSLEYVSSSRNCLGDVAQGYIYLKNWRDLRHCTWQPGYITEDMFTEYYPMYMAIARHVGLTARTAEEMNLIFRDMK